MECSRAIGAAQGKIRRWPVMCKGAGGHTGRGRGWMGGDGKIVIFFGTYNIRSGRNCGIKYVLRVMSQANLDMGVFQETKVIDKIHTRTLAG